MIHSRRVRNRTANMVIKTMCGCFMFLKNSAMLLATSATEVSDEPLIMFFTDFIAVMMSVATCDSFVKRWVFFHRDDGFEFVSGSFITGQKI